MPVAPLTVKVLPFAAVTRKVAVIFVEEEVLLYVLIVTLPKSELMRLS